MDCLFDVVMRAFPKWRTVAFAVLSVLPCAYTASGDDNRSAQPSLVIKGSYAGRYIMDRLVLEWAQERRTVSTRYWPAPNGSCASMLGRHECDIVMKSSDEWNYSDKQVLSKAFKNRSAQPRQYRLGVFAVAVIVNARNKLEGVTSRGLENIFAGKVRDWSAVPGSGLKGPIAVYRPPRNTNGSYIFSHTCLRYRGYAYDKEATVVESRGGMLSRVAKEPAAIGYVLMDPQEGKLGENIRMLPVAGRRLTAKQRAKAKRPRSQPTTQPRSRIPQLPLEIMFPTKIDPWALAPGKAVTPSKSSIFDGSYPLVDPLYLYVHPKAPRHAHEFCRFAVDKKASKILSSHALFPEYERQQYFVEKRLKEFKAGRGLKGQIPK